MCFVACTQTDAKHRCKTSMQNMCLNVKKVEKTPDASTIDVLQGEETSPPFKHVHSLLRLETRQAEHFLP